MRFALLLLCALLAGCDYEEKERTIGYVGAARRDPFLAAQRYLGDIGYHIETRTNLPPRIPRENLALVAPLQAFHEGGMSARVLEWVGRGGHLILFLNGGSRHVNDWSSFGTDDTGKPKPSQPNEHFFLSRFEKEMRGAEQKRLLESLGVTTNSDGGGAINFDILERPARVEMPSRFSVPALPRGGDTVLAGTRDSAALASWARGLGRVTVVADARPFRNRYIGDDDNAWLLWLLIGQEQTGSVWFLYGGKTSFFAMLWEYAWMAVTAFAALLAFWLWKGFPRFGPLRVAEGNGTRDFAEHLHATGAFLWQHHSSAWLVKPLREHVFKLTDARGWLASDADFFEKAGALAGITADRARAALLSEALREPGAFTRVVQDLQALRERLVFANRET